MVSGNGIIDILSSAFDFVLTFCIRFCTFSEIQNTIAFPLHTFEKYFCFFHFGKVPSNFHAQSDRHVMSPGVATYFSYKQIDFKSQPGVANNSFQNKAQIF